VTNYVTENVVGDFNQLPPVGQSPVYNIASVQFTVSFLVGNCLWTPFKLFELTTIMRQKDDLSIQIQIDSILSKKLNFKDKARKDMAGLEFKVLLKTGIKYMITTSCQRWASKWNTWCFKTCNCFT
jgi:hypothetical protein